jgi:hypothetical protein
MNQGLLSVMKARTDGDWELLATAAGEPSSVDRTIAALSGPVLASSGITSGTHARRRVEALAALDIVEVLAVADAWLRPGQAAGNGSGSPPALVEAWATALRFLPQNRQLALLEGDVPGAWEEEKLALTSPIPPFATWEHLIHFVQRARGYAELRAVDRGLFPVTAVTEGVIDALLDVPPRKRWGQFQALRVLRPLIDRLSPNARAFLLDLALASWGEFFGDSPAQLLLYELAFAIDQEAEVVSLAAEHLQNSLDVASGPLHLLQTAYVVSGTGWMMP